MNGFDAVSGEKPGIHFVHLPSHFNSRLTTGLATTHRSLSDRKDCLRRHHRWHLTVSTLQHQRRTSADQSLDKIPAIFRGLEAKTFVAYLACQLLLSKDTNLSAESSDKNVQTDRVQKRSILRAFRFGICVALPVRRREATVETLKY